MRRIQNILFIIIFMLIIAGGFCTLFRTPKLESKAENRSLTQIPLLTAKGFVNGKFQNQFSDALADQFIGSESIKKYMNKYTKFINYNNISEDVCGSRYVKIDDTYAIFSCSESLVYNPKPYEKNVEDKFYEVIDKIDSLADVDLYLYYVNDSYNFDFSKNKMVYDVPKIFKNYNYSMLKVNSFEKFKEYFYATDHHWKYTGSYQGYKDIAKLMDLKNIIKPTGTKEFDVKFYGSMARLSKVEDFYDKFTVYEFDIPEHKEYLNGKMGEYGTPYKYYDGTYNKDKLANHYAYYYGSDYNEVSYDFKDSSKDNLLIISNSFSNAVNVLIASHFDKTYVVDIRHYKDFNYKKYIKDNKIDKVLILGNYNLFFNDVFLNYKWEV